MVERMIISSCLMTYTRYLDFLGPFGLFEDVAKPYSPHHCRSKYHHEYYEFEIEDDHYLCRLGVLSPELRGSLAMYQGCLGFASPAERGCKYLLQCHSLREWIEKLPAETLPV